MDQQKLYEIAAGLADRVLADPRWTDEKDDLGFNVLGMIVYGFTLAMGRIVMILEIDDVNAVLERVLVERVHAMPKWSQGLVAEAARSAFNPTHHPVHYELIGVGHSYCSIQDHDAVVDNVFANITSIRNQI